MPKIFNKTNFAVYPSEITDGLTNGINTIYGINRFNPTQKKLK